MGGGRGGVGYFSTSDIAEDRKRSIPVALLFLDSKIRQFSEEGKRYVNVYDVTPEIITAVLLKTF